MRSIVLLGLVELVGDLADDLLEQVLERDDALHRPVLVDHDRHVLLRALELGQQREQALRLGHHRRRPHELLDVDRRDAAVVHRRDEVADVQHADDLVERLAVDRIARVRRVEHDAQRLLGAACRSRARARRAAGPSRRRRPCRRSRRPCRRSPARRARSRPARPSSRAACAARPRSARVPRRPATAGRAAAARARSSASSSQISGRITKKNARTGVETASAIRSGWPSAIPFGTSSPITTCRYVIIEQREDHGEERRHHRLEQVREDLLAEGADGQRGERDAELHRGDELRRIGRDLQHGARAAVPLALELADARPPRRDEAVLGRHEERVQQDQPGEGDKLERRGSCACAARGAQVLGGKSSSKRHAMRSRAPGRSRG